MSANLWDFVCFDFFLKKGTAGRLKGFRKYRLVTRPDKRFCDPPISTEADDVGRWNHGRCSVHNARDSVTAVALSQTKPKALHLLHIRSLKRGPLSAAFIQVINTSTVFFLNIILYILYYFLILLYYYMQWYWQRITELLLTQTLELIMFQVEEKGLQ